MSELNEQEQIASQDPLNYAPRWLREKPEPRLPEGITEPRTEVKRTEPVVRTPVRGGSPALDRQLENAVYESLRHSLDPQVMPDPSTFGRGPRRRSLAGFASRLVVAVGVSAVVALLFVVMAPTARQANSGTSLASTIQQFSAAVAHTPAATEDAGKPAIAEFKGLIAPSEAGQQAASGRPSDPLLQQFLVWREKSNPNETPK